MYERYVMMRDQKGVKDIDVSRATGIIQSTFSDWKKGKSSPKIEKLQKIAIYFGVSLDWLMGIDEEPSEQMQIDTARRLAHLKEKEEYYVDDETAKIMQDIFNSPGRRALFKAVSNMDENTVKKYAELIEGLTDGNNKNN